MWHLLNCDGVITNKKTVITMTDNKKEQERNELHRTIWAIAGEMRGSVDGWDLSRIYSVSFSTDTSARISPITSTVANGRAATPALTMQTSKTAWRRADGGVTTHRNNTPLTSAVKMHK